MDTRKRLAKGVGFVTAPKATFTILHPRKAAYTKATFTILHPRKAAYTKAAGWVMDRVVPARRRRSRGRTVAAGLGAAAVTVPLGLWVGRRMRSEQQDTPAYSSM